jgi:hypothetical protein
MTTDAFPTGAGRSAGGPGQSNAGPAPALRIMRRAVHAEPTRTWESRRPVLRAQHLPQFHLGLWFTIFASSDQRIIELFYKPEFMQLPASVTVTPGNLLSLARRPCSSLTVRPIVKARPEP